MSPSNLISRRGVAAAGPSGPPYCGWSDGLLGLLHDLWQTDVRHAMPPGCSFGDMNLFGSGRVSKVQDVEAYWRCVFCRYFYHAEKNDPAFKPLGGHTFECNLFWLGSCLLSFCQYLQILQMIGSWIEKHGEMTRKWPLVDGDPEADCRWDGLRFDCANL